MSQSLPAVCFSFILSCLLNENLITLSLRIFRISSLEMLHLRGIDEENWADGLSFKSQRSVNRQAERTHEEKYLPNPQTIFVNRTSSRKTLKERLGTTFEGLLFVFGFLVFGFLFFVLCVCCFVSFRSSFVFFILLQKPKLTHQPLPSTNECVACDVSGGSTASLMKCSNCGGQCTCLVFLFFSKPDSKNDLCRSRRVLWAQRITSRKSQEVPVALQRLQNLLPVHNSRRRGEHAPLRLVRSWISHVLHESPNNDSPRRRLDLRSM